MTETIGAAFGAAALLWIAGFNAGLVFGYVRRLRDVAV